MRIFIFTALFITLSCFSYAQQIKTDSVTVTFKVVVPVTTPDSATIFWAGTLNNWDPGNQGFGLGQKEYAKPATHKDGIWILKLTAPKGSKELYKYTRGSIYSSEEQADYTYRPLRSVVFKMNKTVYDTVKAWHDIPPKSLSDSWPVIPLQKTEINLTYNDRPLSGSGTILYDQELGSRFYNFNDANTKVKKMPDDFYNAIFYYQNIYFTTDDLQLIAAAKLHPEGPWQIYVDQNGDESISLPEKVFTITEKSSQQKWSGMVPFQNIKNNKTFIYSVKLTIRNSGST